MERKATRRYAAALAAIVTTTAGLLAGSGLAAGSASAQGYGGGAFVGPLFHTSTIASTVPGNGDVNPYGVAVIPRTRPATSRRPLPATTSTAPGAQR